MFQNISGTIAFCSFIVATFSFALTVTMILQTRKHNRLTVKLNFKLVLYDFENHIMDDQHLTTESKPAHNSTYNKLAVQCFV